MSGQFKIQLAEMAPKKMSTALKKGKGIHVDLFKNSPGGENIIVRYHTHK